MLLEKKKIRHFSRLLKSCWEGEIIAFPPKFLDYDVLVSFFFLCRGVYILVCVIGIHPDTSDDFTHKTDHLVTGIFQIF